MAIGAPSRSHPLRAWIVADCATVDSLLTSLAERYGSDFLPEALIVMVNGRSIAHTGFLRTPLEDGDLVSIFPIIGGG